MKAIIAPVVQTALAALLMVGALFMFFFGPQGYVMWIYGFFSMEIRQHLWEFFKPEQAMVSLTTQTLMAVALAVGSLYYIAGMWGAYPQYRLRVLGVVGVSAGGMICFMAAVAHSAWRAIGGM